MRVVEKEQGFTLVELMVTMVLALVVMGAVYMLYAQSVAGYRIETQIVDMQNRLRFGLEHLKRDIRRAGFLATPNSLADTATVCNPPATHLRAVTLYPNSGSVYEPYPGANPFIQPVRLTLFGDFFSGRTFMTRYVSGTRVCFDPGSNLPATEIDFYRTFKPYPAHKTRYLRLVTHEETKRETYLAIESVDWPSRCVIVDRPVPSYQDDPVCGVPDGFEHMLEASVAGFVQYRLLTDTRPNAPKDAAGNFTKTDLVREELEVDGETVVPSSQLVIADYAVDLQFYDFGFYDESNPNNPVISGPYPTIAEVAFENGGGLLGNNLGAHPERLRFMTVKLSVRSAEEDPNWFFTKRQQVTAPLMGFELDAMEGACRVATLASRVELASIAVRNLK